MASTLHVTFESSGFVPVTTPRHPCVCISCWQRTGISPLHCGCLADYPQRSRRLRADAAVHDETWWCVYWISWRTFWALIIYIYSFSYNSQKKCFRTHVDIDISFLVLVRGTRAQNLFSHFSYTLYIYFGSHSSTVCMETGCRLADRGFIPGKSLHTDYAIHPASYTMDTGTLSMGTVRPIPRLRMHGAIPPLSHTSSWRGTCILHSPLRKCNSLVVIFCIVTPCNLVGGYQRFRGTHYLQLQDNYFTLKIYAVSFSETVVIYKTTRCHNPGNKSMNFNVVNTTNRTGI
jgi:hypothetical protein